MTKILVGYHASYTRKEVNDLGEDVEFTPSKTIVETESEDELINAYQRALEQGFYDLTIINYDPSTTFEQVLRKSINI